MFIGERMDEKDYQQQIRTWYDPPPSVVAQRGKEKTEAERRAAERVAAQEAADFGAFFGAFSQVQNQTGRG